MRIHRRQFLKYCVGSAAAMSLPLSVIGKLDQALAAGDTTLPKVIWLNGANCTGCTVSLANLFSDSGPTDIADLLINSIDLMFHPTLMAAAGDLAVQQLKDTADGSYILAIDGGIPTAFNGHTCILWTDQGTEVTAMEAVQMLAPGAAAVLSIGTCASYGGMAAASPNPTGIVSVDELTGLSTVNIPGCPTHPDWIVWTIAHLLAGEIPALDSDKRPLTLYGREVHKNCPRKESDETEIFGTSNRCLKELGCKGPRTKSDCPSRKWNNGTNWCIGAESICIGCTEPNFPDKFSPFYKVEYKYNNYEKPTDPDPEPDPDPPTGPDPPSRPLKISKARWNKRKNTLRVRGKAARGQIVTIHNSDSGEQLGAVSARRRGLWKFKLKNPAEIPNQVHAVCGSQIIYRDVANTPKYPGQDDDGSSSHDRDERDDD